MTEKTLSASSREIILKMQQNELNESVIYHEIAKFAKGEHNREVLNRLADEEAGHYAVWQSYTKADLKVQKAKVFKYKLFARIFGFTFAVKLMERGEAGAQKEYEKLLSEVPESASIRKDEEEHEAALLEILDEERLQYVGSMVLGLNDALVELTGSLAGFTFALGEARLIALSGLIIGISATFSMAASEFLSARSEGRDDALKSCTYTGTAYLVTVALLVLPYLLFQNVYVALACMIAMVLLIIAAFSYYTSVALSRPFFARFFEMAGISVGVAVLSFVVGIAAKALLGVDL